MGPKKEPRSRPQYHYFYGSTEELPNSPQISESTDILIGESLVPTDNEEETPMNRARDLRQLVVTNGHNKAALGVYELDEGEPLLATNGTKHKPSKKEEQDWFSSCLDSLLNVQHTYPVAQLARVFVLVTMMILMCTLVMVLKPREVKSATGTINGATIPSLHIPFKVVDRAEYSDPASRIINIDLFEPELLFNGDAKSRGLMRSNNGVDSILKVPFPTGAFWTNLVTKAQSDGVSFPIVAYPYAYKWADSMLQASYPVIRRSVEKLSVQDQFQPDITFKTLEAVSRRHITHFDPLSVTLRYYTPSEGFWETYIVHGSPYITIKYNNATPILRALSTFVNVMCPFDATGNYYDGDEDTVIDGLPGFNRKLNWGVCTPSEGSGDDGTSYLHGVQFLIQSQENITWILFASEMIEISFDTRIRTEIVFSQKFAGVLRLALIPPTAFDDKASPVVATSSRMQNSSGLLRLSESSGLKRLVYHAQVYPVAGSVSWEFKSTVAVPTMAQNALKVISGTMTGTTTTPSNRRKLGTVHFKFETRNLNTANSDTTLALLTLGLPHHADVLGSDVMLSSNQFDLNYWCIKGKMFPVVGSTWSYDEKLTTTTIDREEKVTMDPGVASLILKNLKADMKEFIPDDKLNIYGYGKQVARLAQLAHISKVVTKQSNSTSRMVGEITGQLYQSLAQLLDGSVEDDLVYDGEFGGIVSRNGLRDINEDFGNGRYNDHHFHYGYILYASAIMASLNSSFVIEYGDAVDSLLYDITYQGNGDSLTVDKVFFPLARYKSWYDGHSFASGLFSSANGKSQESTSEAVNGYYGAYLWSLVKFSLGVGSDTTGDFKDYIRLLLATEIRGAKTYWHMMPPQPGVVSNSTSIPPQMTCIYPASLRENYMIGNLGMLDAVCNTYFAKELFYVHLINILPITAITAELFDPIYVAQQYENVIAKTEIPNAWKGYAICNQAIAEPNAAWQAAQKLISAQLDPGLSKSQVLYFISTIDGFQAPEIPVDEISDDDSTAPRGYSSDGDSPGGADPTENGASSCSAHSKCSPLIGSCCPTIDGTMLECCQ